VEGVVAIASMLYLAFAVALYLTVVYVGVYVLVSVFYAGRWLLGKLWKSCNDG
jgi:hypothetical protein